MDAITNQLDMPIGNIRDPVIEAGQPLTDRMAEGNILIKLIEGDEPP